jgi:integrase/recombinase XerD
MGLKVITREGTDFLYLRGSVRGISVFESTKTTDTKAAKEICAKREAELLDQSVFGRKATVTFEVAVESYLKSGGSKRFLGKFNPVTGKWSKGLVTHFGKKLIHTITQDDLDGAGNKLYPGTSHVTRNRQCHTPFVAIWNHAHRNQWCDARQWARPRKPKGTNVKFLNQTRRAGSFPVSYEHAAEFVKAMSPAPAMLMTTFFYTGMRPIELFTLESKQVNIKGRWITLPNSKTGEARGVPMHEALVPMFTGLVKRGGFLFRTSRGVPYEPKDEEGEGGGQMKTAINGARKRSGIRDIAPYTGRHSVSTQLVINGVHPHIKDQILGHAADDMSRHYTSVPQAPLIEAINTLPVIRGWTDAPWMLEPLAWAHKLAEGTGKRTDLGKKRKAL